MSKEALLASCPDEHKAALTSCLASAPEPCKGPLINLITKLKGLNIPLSKILTLYPLIMAAIATPATGVPALIAAIAALIDTPTPAPAPTPAS